MEHFCNVTVSKKCKKRHKTNLFFSKNAKISQKTIPKLRKNRKKFQKMPTFILPILPNSYTLTPTKLHFQFKIDYRLEKKYPNFMIFSKFLDF